MYNYKQKNVLKMSIILMFITKKMNEQILKK